VQAKNVSAKLATTKSGPRNPVGVSAGHRRLTLPANVIEVAVARTRGHIAKRADETGVLHAAEGPRTTSMIPESDAAIHLKSHTSRHLDLTVDALDRRSGQTEVVLEEEAGRGQLSGTSRTPSHRHENRIPDGQKPTGIIGLDHAL
jgi:hypothetical protein